MKNRLAIVSILFATAPGFSGCTTLQTKASIPNRVVGAWVVRDPNAPFPYHMYVFNADGTMQQANPDAGDPHGSDSDGKGVWVANGERVTGKWVELTADRATHQYTGRLEISYEITVTRDTYTATEVVHSYNADGKEMASPATPAKLVGTRVTLP